MSKSRIPDPEDDEDYDVFGDQNKSQVLVRMPLRLYAKISRDAQLEGRTNPAQVRQILYKHYGMEPE